MRVAVLVLLAMLAGDDWQFRVSRQATSQPADFKEADAVSPYYLVLFTASWCQPCQAYKARTLPALKQKFDVIETDMDKNPEWWRARVVTVDGKKQTVQGVAKIPTVWLVRRSDKMPVARWQGGATVAQVQAALTQQEQK